MEFYGKIPFRKCLHRSKTAIRNEGMNDFANMVAG